MMKILKKSNGLAAIVVVCFILVFNVTLLFLHQIPNLNNLQIRYHIWDATGQDRSRTMCWYLNRDLIGKFSYKVS